MQFESGKLVPDFKVKTNDGRVVDIWSYRQKSHAAVVLKNDGPAAAHEKFSTEAASRQKTWVWLGVEILFATATTPPTPDGVYLIDRYGAFIATIPLSPDMWEQLEKELIYYESCNC